MEKKMFVRVCKTLSDKGTLVPLTEAHKQIIDSNTDYYASIYYYNEEQKKQSEELITVDGKTRKRGISGITDVVTNKLVWDFDSESNIEASKKDAVTLCNRLKEKGMNLDDLNICFSGNKGFAIEVTTDTFFNPTEFKNVVTKLAENLQTFDSKVVNPSRVFRIPFTKHNKSGLYKTPITYQELNDLSVEQIVEISKTQSTFDSNFYYHKTALPKDIVTLKAQTPPPAAATQTTPVSINELDFTKRPKWLSSWKYALLNGFFPSGTRSYALMVLASTYKAQGLPETVTYYALKGAAELQSRRYNQEKFDKTEIYNNIIKQVYGPLWQGGTYSEDNFPKELIRYFEEHKIPRRSEVETDDMIEQVSSGYDSFIKYAEEIEKHTMRFGIPELDTKLKIRKGHLIGVIGSPGSGKCHGKDTSILMYDGSVKMVQDVVVGDLLMGDDSTPRRVLSLARGVEQLYRVHTDDGHYDVNESHILSLKTTSSRLMGLSKGSVINVSVHEYLQSNEHFKRRTMGYRNSIEFKEQVVEFDPYMVGIWLGDGTRSKPEVTNPTPEIRDYIQQFCDNNSLRMTTYEVDKCPRYNVVKQAGGENTFWTFLKNTFNKGEKFIPNNYLINTRHNRLRMLAGLLDTDGYKSKTNDSYELTFKDKRLTEDTRFLCRSLGIKATITQVEKSCGEFTGTYYRLYITGDLSDVPFLLKKNFQEGYAKQRNPEFHRIKLEKLQVDNYYGFELDGNHLYVLGDLTVTHNTSTAITMLNNMSKQGVHSYFSSLDMYKNNVYQKLIQRHTDITEDELFDAFKNRNIELINSWKKLLVENYGNVTFCFRSTQSIPDLKLSIKKQEEVTGKPIDMVVVDYLELIDTDKSDPTAASSEAIQGLREIANEGRVVVVLLQPNKLNSKPNEPLLSYNAAKGSSSIAQACTAILTVHRPGLNPTNPETDKYFSICCVKNRNGSLFSVDFGWIGKTQTIYTMSDIEREELEEVKKLTAIQNSAKDI